MIQSQWRRQMGYRQALMMSMDFDGDWEEATTITCTAELREAALAEEEPTAPRNESNVYVCVCKMCHSKAVVLAKDEAALLAELASWQEEIPEVAAKREMERDYHAIDLKREREVAEMYRKEALAVAEAAQALAAAKADAAMAEYEAEAEVLAAQVAQDAARQEEEVQRLQAALRTMEQKLCAVEAETSLIGVQLQFQEERTSASTWTPAVAAELEYMYKYRARSPRSARSASAGPRGSPVLVESTRRSASPSLEVRSPGGGFMLAQPVRIGRISMPPSQLPREWSRHDTSPRAKFVAGISNTNLSEPPSELDRHYTFSSSPRLSREDWESRRVMAQRSPSSPKGLDAADETDEPMMISKHTSEPGWASLVVVSDDHAPLESPPPMQTFRQEERVQDQPAWRLAQHRTTSYDASTERPSVEENRREVLGLAGTSTIRSLVSVSLLGQPLSDRLSLRPPPRAPLRRSPVGLAQRSPVGFTVHVGI